VIGEVLTVAALASCMWDTLTFRDAARGHYEGLMLVGRTWSNKVVLALCSICSCFFHAGLCERFDHLTACAPGLRITSNRRVVDAHGFRAVRRRFEVWCIYLRKFGSGKQSGRVNANLSSLELEVQSQRLVRGAKVRCSTYIQSSPRIPRWDSWWVCIM
jgi:hypothetical protein